MEATCPAGALVLTTDQARDSFTRTALGPRASARLLYQRCGEARGQSLPGQDYAKLTAESGGDSLCFCVCDGVGSSYRGDFAARFLADRIVGWLGALASLPDEPERFQQLTSRLREELTGWAREAHNTLLAQALPAGAVGIVGEVLHELRAEYGGEAVFLAGRLDTIRDRAAPATPGAGTLDALPHIQAIFCSLGNVAGQVRARDTWVELTAADDRNRWSSARSLRGQLHCWQFAPGPLDRLIVYTDGARALRPHVVGAGDTELRERAATLLVEPSSDDVTILDITWCSEQPSSRMAEGDTPHG